MKNQSLRTEPAFSIIETLVAITVLMLVLLGSVALGSASLRNIVRKAQMAQATSIAQSQLEKVRNIRDNIFLDASNADGKGWSAWVGPRKTEPVAVQDGGRYYIASSSTGFYLFTAPVGQVQPQPLLFGDNSYANYEGSVSVKEIPPSNITPFEVTGSTDQALNHPANGMIPKIYQIESRVIWDSFGPQEVVLNTYLSDWLPKF